VVGPKIAGGIADPAPNGVNLESPMPGTGRVVDGFGNTDARRFSDLRQTSRKIHAVAQHILFLAADIANVNADAVGQGTPGLDQTGLDLLGGFQGLIRREETGKNAVSRAFKHLASVPTAFFAHQAEVLLQLPQGRFLILAGAVTKIHHIRKENRHQPLLSDRTFHKCFSRPFNRGKPLLWKGSDNPKQTIPMHKTFLFKIIKCERPAFWRVKSVMQTKLIPRKGGERLLAALVFLGINFLFSSCKDTPTQLKIRAETGELQAIVRLAEAYQQGVYEDQPMPYWPEEAFRLFRQAAQQGDPKGMKGLGWCFLEGEGTPVNWREGASWLVRGYREAYRDRKKTLNQLRAEASSGSAKSQYRLALIYRDGQGVDPDPVQAIRLFGQAAQAGYGDSGQCLDRLKSAWKNFQETEKRAQAGDASAMVRYAEYLEGNSPGGLLVKADWSKACAYLEKSAKKSPEGKMALARHLLRKGPSSEDRVRKLCLEASREGYPPALEFIAGLQADPTPMGGGSLFSEQESLQTCEELAEAGMRDAQVLLAKKYLAGDGCPVAPARAIPWLKRAANPQKNESGLIGVFFDGLFGPDRGDAEAQFLLGCCYRDGRGVGQSDSEAIRWLQLSAQNGRGEAQAALAAMRLARN